MSPSCSILCSSSGYLSFFQVLSILFYSHPVQQSQQFCEFSFFVVDYNKVWSTVCMSKSYWSLYVSFSRTDAGLCMYDLFVWSNLNFLLSSKDWKVSRIPFVYTIWMIIGVIYNFTNSQGEYRTHFASDLMKIISIKIHVFRYFRMNSVWSMNSFCCFHFRRLRQFPGFHFIFVLCKCQQLLLWLQLWWRWSERSIFLRNKIGI